MTSVAKRCYSFFYKGEFERVSVRMDLCIIVSSRQLYSLRHATTLTAAMMSLISGYTVSITTGGGAGMAMTGLPCPVGSLIYNRVK